MPLTVSQPRVRARRAARVEELLDRAMDIVEEGGLEALTLHRLAEALGLVKTAVYRYFPSKDALTAALQRKAIREVHEHFVERRGAARAAWGSPPARVAALAELLLASRLYASLPETHPRAWLFLAILLGDPRRLIPDEDARATVPILAAFLEDVAASFEAARASGALAPGPARPRMMTFWAVVHGALCLEKARRVDMSLPAAERIAEHGAKTLLGGWGAEPSMLDAAWELVGQEEKRRSQ